jgi:uncharacterized repeat protein (TIGR03803 family)
VAREYWPSRKQSSACTAVSEQQFENFEDSNWEKLMKIRTGRFCTFTLILLLSLFGFAAKAGAQDNILNQLSGSPKLPGKTGRTHRSKTPSDYSESVLYSFCSASNCTDGANPVAGLIQDAAGNLYGTTTAGGDVNDFGTVFKLLPPAQQGGTWAEMVLHRFNCTDGAVPNAALIQDATGNLYGTTKGGGSTCNYPLSPGDGTVFKLDNTGQESVLYSFTGGADGSAPVSDLIQDAAGNLYGTTIDLYGGANVGTVFKLDNTDKETVLYGFTGGADGAEPYGGLVEDAAGNLYGTTYYGGANNSGTVFKLDNTGQETVLNSFTGGADGGFPPAGLVRDAAGNLHGTTESGGNLNCISGKLAPGCGTVFEVDNTGNFTVLYTFCSASNCTDGSNPFAGLIQDATGNLYGTTRFGGANVSPNGFGGGAVFKLLPPAQQGGTWTESVLYSFCSASKCTDGYLPEGRLVQDAAGNLYGTTQDGGANAHGGSKGGGTVFELVVGGGGGGGTAMVTLTSSPNPSYVDQSVTFSAAVSGSGAAPTGSVTFKEGTTALGTVTLADGQATFTTAFTKKGSVSILASYSGDQNYKAANSKALKQVVKQYTTSTALASNLNPATYGQAVTLTATVSSAGPTPTGTVTFKNGSTSLGSASLSGGVASITTSTLPVGTLTITASYGGDAASAKSTSPALTQVVNQATSTTTIVSSVNPSKVGQKVKFTATVTSPTTTPTGTVTFKDGSTVLGTGTLAKGKASYSTSTLSAGSHNITAVYEATANISGSTSPVLVQTVN